MKKMGLLIFLALLLTGCGTLAEVVPERGAQAMDQSLAASEWFVCNAASVGSVKRRYGNNKETAEAWRTLCREGDAVLIEPEVR